MMIKRYRQLMWSLGAPGVLNYQIDLGDRLRLTKQLDSYHALCFRTCNFHVPTQTSAVCQRLCNHIDEDAKLIYCFIPLKTNRRSLYLKTQSVPRCKHFHIKLRAHRDASIQICG